jgi:hypothetical protein
MESSNASKISDFLKLPGYRIQFRQVIYTVQQIKALQETDKKQAFEIIKVCFERVFNKKRGNLALRYQKGRRPQDSLTINERILLVL